MVGEVVEAAAFAAADAGCNEVGGGARDQVTCAAAAAGLSAGRADVLADGIDFGQEFVDALAGCGGGFQKRDLVADGGADGERAGELLHGLLGAGSVAFVNDKDVGDFEQARFHGLNIIA